MIQFRWRLVAAVLALTVLSGSFAPAAVLPALAQAPPNRVGIPPAEPDYPIPNGHFFTESAPGQNGAGYRVANEAGIPFHDAFMAEGGVGTLGYPLTRRFVWRDSVVQLFQNGALRWVAPEARTVVIPAREIGEAPSEAKRAEPPHRFSADARRYPWSGWWWPANDVVGGPRLFDPNGPLAKYDQYVIEARGEPNPGTVEWERAELRFARVGWAGHCNGWAAAALLEPEPTEERTVGGITFSVADQKGLLTSYHFADAAEWAAGSEDVDVAPHELHHAITYSMGVERRGVVMTFRPVGDEIWSYPAYKLETVFGPDPVEPDLWHVRTTVWLVDNEVPAGFVGARPWPGPDGKLLEYTLRGDPYRPTGGEWHPRTSGRFGRPFMVWYPDPRHRNVGRQLASPALDYRLILEITRGFNLRPLFDPRIPGG